MYFVIMYTFAVHKREYSKVDSNLPSSFNINYSPQILNQTNVTKERKSVQMRNVFENHMSVMEVHQIVQMGRMKQIAQVEYW